MMDNNDGQKPKYESPTVIPLGELARGSGFITECANGSGAAGGACIPGADPIVISNCSAGTPVINDP